jgi:ribosomal protein L13
LQYRFIEGALPAKKEQSAYVSVSHKGQIWHLFNAERMPLGQMARMIAIYIRGKHKPTYVPNKNFLGDKCVVVNAGKVRVTGNKMD